MMRFRLYAIIILYFLSACRSTDSKPDSELQSTLKGVEFTNYSGSIVCKPGTAITVDSVQRIQSVVRSAVKEKRNIRVWSLPAPRSYSPVICPEDGGVLLNVHPLNKLVSIDPEALTAVVQPGILINELLDQLDAKGFTFPVSPDYSGISIAGGMATGAHHSSLRFPAAIGDWVEEVKLVDGTGEIRTLVGVELDTARVHLGLLGVVFEMKIRILPQYKLKYAIDNRSDKYLERDIVSLVRSHDYARVMWFPTQKSFVLDSFDKVPLSTPGESYNNIWSSTPDVSWLGDLPVGTLNSNQLVQCTAEAVRAKLFAGSFKGSKFDFKTPVGLSHKMFVATCEPGKCSWDYGIKTRTVEIGMPLDRLQDWLKDVRAIVAARRACFPILGIYLRFSAASKAALGQASGHDNFVFEIHVPQTSSPSLEPSSDVYDEMVQMSLSKYQGRPHWGKNSLPYFLNLGPEQFPQWEKFVQLQTKIDPEGIFESPLWKQMNTRSSLPREPACAVSKLCICQEDSDCGENARCEAGVFFTEARVCRK